MKSFYEYLSEQVTEYKYRIKTIEPLDSVRLNQLNTVLMKYHPSSISEIKKTIIQKFPLDFRNIQDAEVYYIDITTKIPVSSYILQQEIRGIWDISEHYIVVRGYNEPIELETEVMDAIDSINKEAEGKNLVRKSGFSTSPEYKDYIIDNEEVYGSEYNKKFLEYLASLSKNRKDPVYVPEIGQKPFDWLKPHLEDEVAEDFNKDFDTVKPLNRNNVGKNVRDPSNTSKFGNFDDTRKVYSELFTDGKKDILIKKSGKEA